jgi:hypothetical protein
MHDPADANNSRHVVLGGVVGEIHTNRLDMRKVTDEMVVRWLPETGSPVEQAGMEYHAQRVHSSITPAGDPLGYILNGRGPVSGAPFADPCIDDQGQPVGNWSVGEVKVPGTNGNVANTLLGPDNSAPARTYKAADIQLDMVINKLGEHYPQARMLALWDDVDGFMYNNVPPEPLFFRANSRECIEFWQTNLVPHEYELDDFQVRTPTDIIGQHIHLVKFDVTSADGAGNGWNYEDAAFSPGEIIERIHAVNAANGLHLDPSQTTCLDSDGLSASGCVFPQEHSFFAGDLGLGAVTVRQRWYVDETMSMTGDDRTLRTVYTHDHYGPSTHQQVGLYAGLLIEPEDSEWFDMVSGAQMGGRFDGGPTSWRANIHTNTKLNGDPDPDQSESYREFMFEFADFALAYSPDNQTQSLGTTVTQDMIYPPTDVYTQDQLDELTAHNFVNRDLSINPPAKETVGLPFVLVKAKHCPGIDPLGPESKTCPEGVSADDPGSFVANYRNESVTHRIRNPNPQAKADVDVYPYFDTVTFPGDGDTDHDGDGLVDLEDVDVDPLDGPFPNLSAGDIDHDGDGVYDLADVDEAPYAGTLTFPGEGDTDHNGDGSVNASELESDDCLFPSDFSKKSIGADGVERTINGCQAAGMPGDLGHVYRSDIGRANPWLNTAVGNTPYAPLTGGVRPGDPFTPLMQVFEDDRLQFRFMVGAHEEGHVETIQGAKWLFEPNSKTSGWRGALMAGISEHFEFEIQNLAPVKGGAPFADMLYNFDTSVDGAGNGVWGLIRSYSSPQALDPAIDGTLLTLPNNSNGKSPGGGDIENMAQFNGVCPADTENKKGKNSGPNPYWGGERKFHVVAIRAADALPGGTLEYNSRVGGPFAKHPGPLHDPAAIMYVLANDLDGNNQLKPGVPVEPLVLRARAGECVHVTLDNRLPDDEAQVLDPDHFSIVPMVIERFNTNEMHISSEVGLRPQMVAYDVATSEGVNLGFNVSHWSKRTAGPGETVTYKWYMGDTRIIPNPEHSCTIIEKKYKGQIQEVEECTGKPFIKHATPIEFGATNLIPADPIEHAAKGLIRSNTRRKG